MNSNPTILIDFQPAEPIEEAVRARVLDAEIRVGPGIDDPAQTMPKELMQGVDALLCTFPPANFNDFDTLRWIQLVSAGYAQVFGLPVVERGIQVSNGRGVFDVPIAEWIVMMLLNCHRELPVILENQRNCVWDRNPRFQRELRSNVVGFYGYGGIAREAARLVKAMGLEVWTLTRDGKVSRRDNFYRVDGTGDVEGALPDRAFSPAEQEEFLGGVDFLVIAMPLTKNTEGLLGERELRMLKPEACLLNVGRAHIIQEQALVRCMTEGWIRGAAIDVHYAYPLPPDHPLWTAPNLMLTPHISGSDAQPYFVSRIADIFAQNLERLCNGQPLLNALTETQLRGE